MLTTVFTRVDNGTNDAATLSRILYEIAKPAINDMMPNGNAKAADNAIRLSNLALAASLLPRAR
jgi:hypothetical protein